MEKCRKFFISAVVFFLIVLIVILVYQYSCRTINSQIREKCDIVYIPNGMANSYKNLITFSIDEHIIWEYKLNLNEKKKIQQNLDNDIWNIVTDKNKGMIMNFFEKNSESFCPEEVSEVLYYCLYDVSKKEFVNIEDDLAMLGWHRILFLYDKEAGNYFCVSKSI